MKSISEEQQKQIIQYLQTKNLFEDTIVELSEHFTNHINHLIRKLKIFGQKIFKIHGFLDFIKFLLFKNEKYLLYAILF